MRAHLAADVDLAELGNRFALTGGDIRNAATTAVLLAAADQITSQAPSSRVARGKRMRWRNTISSQGTSVPS